MSMCLYVCVCLYMCVCLFLLYEENCTFDLKYKADASYLPHKLARSEMLVVSKFYFNSLKDGIVCLF